MTRDETLAALAEKDLVTLTLYGEARGESINGLIAVGNVIRNRVTDGRWGSTYRSVCLAPWQFSCWQPEGGQANYDKVMALAAKHIAGAPLLDARLRQCAWVAQGIMDDAVLDIVHGATHYLTTRLLFAKPPKWTVGQSPVAVVASHSFFARIA